MEKRQLKTMLLTATCASAVFAAGVQAQGVDTQVEPISFASMDHFGNVACVPTGDTPQPRDVVYTLANAQANSIALDNIHVKTLVGDTSAVLISVKDDILSNADSCLDGVFGGTSYGVIDAFGTCELTLEVTPPNCPNNQILHETIERQLYIGVQTREQTELTSDIDAAVSVIGSGAEFALFVSGFESGLVNDNDSGATQVVGDIGADTVNGNFQVTNGETIGSAEPRYIAAQADFEAAYAQLITNKTNAMPINGLADDASLAAGYYRFDAGSSPEIITVSGTIELTGPGDDGIDYFFFVNAQDRLHVLADTVFVYENGASPANVFWIIGDTQSAEQVLIYSGAQFDGNILAGSPTPATFPTVTTTDSGTSHAQFRGSIWSGGAGQGTVTGIQMHGDSITVAE